MRLGCDEPLIDSRLQSASEGASSRLLRPEVQPKRATGFELLEPIPAPGLVRWREFRLNVLPVVLFLLVLGVVIWLWCNLPGATLVWSSQAAP